MIAVKIAVVSALVLVVVKFVASVLGACHLSHNTICASRLRLLFVQNQDKLPNDFSHLPLDALQVIVGSGYGIFVQRTLYVLYCLA